MKANTDPRGPETTLGIMVSDEERKGGLQLSVEVEDAWRASGLGTVTTLSHVTTRYSLSLRNAAFALFTC